jgi:hypothetical protein
MFNDTAKKLKVTIKEGYIPTPQFVVSCYKFSINGIVETSDVVGLS